MKIDLTSHGPFVNGVAAALVFGVALSTILLCAGLDERDVQGFVSVVALAVGAAVGLASFWLRSKRAGMDSRGMAKSAARGFAKAAYVLAFLFLVRLVFLLFC